MHHYIAHNCCSLTLIISRSPPGKFWKLKLKILESDGIYLWLTLTNMHNNEFGLLLTETVTMNFVIFDVPYAVHLE